METLRNQIVESFLVLPEIPPLGDLAIGVEMEDVDDLLLDPVACKFRAEAVVGAAQLRVAEEKVMASANMPGSVARSPLAYASYPRRSRSALDGLGCGLPWMTVSV
jgi:hypothetical protein